MSDSDYCWFSVSDTCDKLIPWVIVIIVDLQSMIHVTNWYLSHRITSDGCCLLHPKRRLWQEVTFQWPACFFLAPFSTGEKTDEIARGINWQTCHSNSTVPKMALVNVHQQSLRTCQNLKNHTYDTLKNKTWQHKIKLLQ